MEEELEDVHMQAFMNFMNKWKFYSYLFKEVIANSKNLFKHLETQDVQ